MIDYHEAIREMHKGRVVKYLGTVNGNVWSVGCLVSWLVGAAGRLGLFGWLVGWFIS